jgi:hypothetical protein
LVVVYEAEEPEAAAGEVDGEMPAEGARAELGHSPLSKGWAVGTGPREEGLVVGGAGLHGSQCHVVARAFDAEGEEMFHSRSAPAEQHEVGASARPVRIWAAAGLEFSAKGPALRPVERGEGLLQVTRGHISLSKVEDEASEPHLSARWRGLEGDVERVLHGAVELGPATFAESGELIEVEGGNGVVLVLEVEVGVT